MERIITQLCASGADISVGQPRPAKTVSLPQTRHESRHGHHRWLGMLRWMFRLDARSLPHADFEEAAIPIARAMLANAGRDPDAVNGHERPFSVAA